MESKFKVFNVLKIVSCNLLFTECTVVIGFVSLLRVYMCVYVDMEKFNNGALMSCRCRSHYQTSLRKLFPRRKMLTESQSSTAVFKTFSPSADVIPGVFAFDS